MSFSQTPRTQTPDEGVLQFVEGELRANGRLNGFSAFTLVNTLKERGVTASHCAGLRLALAMYGEQVDPSARDLFRATISSAL